MKRRFGSRNTVSASTATLALVAAFAACVTDEPNIVPCGEPTDLWCPPRTVCAMDGNRCDPEDCGDGILDRLNGEVCDDGNLDDGDLCSADCRVLENCGNGKLDPGELCDATAPDSIRMCGTDCQPLANCGDGEVNSGEDCDEGIDGIQRSTPTCNADCSVPWCGDGRANTSFVNPATGRPEECDTVASTATCDADCTLPKCGDALFNASFVNPDSSLPEQCDEGGDAPSCDRDCTLPECGDGLSNNAAGEECDEGKDATLDPPAPKDSVTCDVDCTRPACGDGHPNSTVGEACDDGMDTLNCDRHDCTLPECGDGYINRAAGEACDDGMGGGGDDDPTRDACPSGPLGNCRLARCGDGFVHNRKGGEEACDDGVSGIPRDSADCDQDCTRVVCGDGDKNVAAGENCDDGNTSDLDACPSGTAVPPEDHRARCQPARCGDGFRQTDVEGCDDGDSNNSDSCPTDIGGTCQNARCGDGFVWREDLTEGQEAEICDDGRDSATCNGDSAAAVDAGADCHPPICGDGYVNLAAGEQCEDSDDCGLGLCIPSGSLNQCRCVSLIH